MWTPRHDHQAGEDRKTEVGGRIGSVPGLPALLAVLNAMSRSLPGKGMRLLSSVFWLLGSGFWAPASEGLAATYSPTP